MGWVSKGVAGYAMQSCTQCGRPRSEGTRFCTGCGTSFPDTDPGNISVSDSGRLPHDSGRTRPPADISEFPGERVARRAPSGRTLRPVVVAFVIVVAIVAAGAGAGVWLHGRHGPASRPAASRSTRNAVPSPAATTVTTPTSPAGPSSPAVAATTGSDAVALAAGVAQSPATQSVVTFLDEYFTAINSHDYQGYLALLSPQLQQGLTAEHFNNGYNSTVDSGETLQSISTAADGDTAAAVTFISHQNPDSANQEQSCTSWSITLFLGQGGGGYVIDQPPSGYHASSGPC